MRVAITGGYGFLGWHLACRLRATQGIEPVRLGRRDFADPPGIAEALADVDVVIHLAGVNRADTDEEVEDGNVALATALAEALGDDPRHVVYGNSVQSDLDNPYGRGKRRAAEILSALPGTLADVHLPNLFGEHGLPAYNSFVATFCYEVAAGRQPTVAVDNQVALMHAQDAAQSLIEAASLRRDHQPRPEGAAHGVLEVLAQINEFHAIYTECGDIPDLSTKFAVDLFNTYRSYAFPDQFPVFAAVHRDARGELFEAARAHGGNAQAFVSTTEPGATRGDHYHLHKVERFFVVKGEAEISLRRLLHDELVTFHVSGDKPGFVDMPTMWAHKIRNVGDSDLVTMFWADQLLDPDNPDQFPERVEPQTFTGLAETTSEETL